jgi:hypothetical protein
MPMNGAFMVASPRAWFRPPTWLRAEAPFTEEKYTRGWGAVHLRLTGALILAATTCVFYVVFLRQG